jgi:hypothetical protein
VVLHSDADDAGLRSVSVDEASKWFGTRDIRLLEVVASRQVSYDAYKLSSW